MCGVLLNSLSFRERSFDFYGAPGRYFEKNPGPNCQEKIQDGIIVGYTFYYIQLERQDRVMGKLPGPKTSSRSPI